MPWIHPTSLSSRRRFLQRAAGAAACFAWAPRSWAEAENEAGTRRWALLADTHVAADKNEVYRGAYPYKNLEAVIPAVRKEAPSGAMIVGDVSRLDGQPADYKLVKSMLEPLAKEVPVFLGLGNHDDRDEFQKIFSQSPPGGTRQKIAQRHVIVMDQSPVVRIVLLDSLQHVNRAPGELGKAQLNWLAKYLSAADSEVPLMIAVHHTLGPRGHLQDWRRFFELIDEAPEVKAIFYGHSHKYGLTERKGIYLVNLPPVGYNFDGVSPLGWLDAEFSSSGVDLTLRTLDPKGPGGASTRKLTWR